MNLVLKNKILIKKKTHRFYTTYNIIDSQKQIHFIENGESVNSMFNVGTGCPTILLSQAAHIVATILLSQNPKSYRGIQELSYIDQEKISGIWMKFFS